MAPHIFTIPPHLPFADTLAAGLLERANGLPDALARMTVLLPTRRACRALREAFLRASEGRPLLLPRMSPIGDVDEEELVLTAGEYGETGAAFADLPPAISNLRRRLLLTELILAFEARRGAGASPDQAAWLAADLARLLDEMQTERRSFGDLAGIVPEELAAHWQDTLSFLGIVSEQWPAILALEGALDPVEHRNRLLAAQAAAWRAKPPTHPIFAAGSTGSIPATADLLKTIAYLPQGTVVLPGLDRALDGPAWEHAREAPSHPQHGLARLLEHLGVTREKVADWSAAPVPALAAARHRLISAALRPAEAPPRRPGDDLDAETVSRTLAGGLSYLECSNPREEAATIALLLREALEIPGRTAALVTPDRDLARRVAAALGRWNIAIDDSAGLPLAATPPLAFLRLVLDAAESNFAPVPFLAALKHPLAAAGVAPAVLRSRVRALERAVLRGPRPPAGLDGIKRVVGTDTQGFARWLDSLASRWKPLEDARAAESLPVGELLRAHVATAESLAADHEGGGARRLWAGEAGEAAAGFFDELNAALRGFAPIAPRDYPELFEALIAGAVVRPRFGTHPRLAILGPLEARLQRFDLMILGGLNEGVWPAVVAADPWMSRPMRTGIGLPLAERRIGLSAHDFVQAAMAPEVVLTRSLRQNNQPTRPSRWLLRIEAELDGLGFFKADSPWKAPAWRSPDYQTLSRELDRAALRPVLRPAPCPPVPARPRRLSVTQIERWRRDPYTVYARHILKLEALDPLDADAAAADLGTALHDALAAFLKELGAQPIPADGFQRLMRAADDALASLLDRPGVWAFWRPRFERIARWFVATESARRTGGTLPVVLEERAATDFAAPAGPFTLSGKADRIDRHADGTLTIIDYKTGVLPKRDEIDLGFAPQLPLEGVLLQAGAFAGVTGRIAALEYWRLAGNGGGTIVPVKSDPATLIAEAAQGLAALIARYDDPATRYPATPRPSRKLRFNDYAQLARTAEWIGGGRR